MHQGALQRQFFGRDKLLAKAVEMVDAAQSKGEMMVVEGAPGEGKSFFMVSIGADLVTLSSLCDQHTEKRPLSLYTGCTCRCSQEQKEEQGKPAL